MAFIKSTNLITAESVTIPGLVGGTNNRVVRITANNTVTDAGYGDTAGQLNAVLLKVAGTYYSSGLVTGAGSFTAGSSLYLGQFGAIVSTPPIPTASIRVLYIGFAINSTDMIFRPGIPISG